MVLTVGLRDREAGSTGLGGRDDGARWHLDLVVLAEELELAVVAADGARDVDREQACKSHAVTSGVCSVSREDGQGGHKAITDGTDGRTDGGGGERGRREARLLSALAVTPEPPRWKRKSVSRAAVDAVVAKSKGEEGRTGLATTPGAAGTDGGREGGREGGRTWMRTYRQMWPSG